MPMYLTKSLAAISTNLGAVSTTAAGITFPTSAFDTQRRLSWVTSASKDFSAVSIVITGVQDGGNTMTETVRGASVGTTFGTTIQDYLRVTSVTISCSPTDQTLQMVTTANGGTSWVPVNTCIAQTNIGFSLTYSSTASTIPFSAAVEYSWDNPPGQGIQSPSTASKPFPITSTAISTTANTNVAGVCTLPIACWRMTLTSTSTAGTTTTSSLKVYLSALQTGLGSAL